MSIIANNQVGSVVAGGTTITGILANFGITPDTMSILATFVAILLTMVMLWGHIRRIINDGQERKEKARAAALAEKKALLELDKLRREISKAAQ